MKVLLRRNVLKLGKIGDVVEVKPGYARNYLLPQGLAVQPTKANVRSIELEKRHYLVELAKKRTELEAKLAVVAGKELTIAARANVEGHLYGSIGKAQIVAALAAEDIFIEPEHIVMDHPIRQVDKYDLTIQFAEDISTTIHVWIVPVGGDDEDGQAEQPSSGSQEQIQLDEQAEPPSQADG